MKKTISIILTLTLLVFSLFIVGCGKVKDGATVERLATKTPMELYHSELNAISKSYVYSITTTQVIAYSTKTTTDTISVKTDGYNAYSKTQSETTPSSNVEAWYVDGTLYTYMMGTKSKTSYSLDTFTSKYMNGNTLNASLLDLDDTAFGDAVFVRKDGYWTVTLTLDRDYCSTLLVNSSTSGTISLTRLPVGDVVYEMFFNDDGKLQKISAYYDVNDIYNIAVKAKCTLTTVIQIGDVTVSAPADASSYQSVNLPN